MPNYSSNHFPTTIYYAPLKQSQIDKDGEVPLNQTHLKQ